MTTVVVAENLAVSEFSDPITIESGLYMLAVSHTTASGPVVGIFVNIGPAIDVPLYADAPNIDATRIITLPTCTLYVQNGTGPGTLNVALARLGDASGIVEITADLGFGPEG